jgi:hypothetical protein
VRLITEPSAGRDGESFAANVAAGCIGRTEAALLQKGFEAWLHSNGAVPLERCLHLPTSPKAMARVRRDKWLNAAWQLIDAPGAWLRSVALARELATFEARIWPAWRHNDAPPEGASDLRRALFAVLTTGAKIPTTAQQLHNICKTFR